MGSHKVTITSDWAYSFLTMCHHSHRWIPPSLPPKLPPFLPHFECPVTINYPPGAGEHKLTNTVRHQKRFIAKEAHDCGVLIPHASVPHAGILIAIAFSSRKMAFSASTVKMNGAPTGISNLWPFTPML